MRGANLTGQAPPALPGVPFPVDFDRLIWDADRLFNPLHGDKLLDFHVSGAKDGYVCLSIALPEGMTRGFVSMLESLCCFMRAVDVKSRSASAYAKVMDPAFLEERERLHEEFKREVCALFDGFTSQGVERKEAIKRTNASLKASGSPWATFDTVQGVLRSCGRFRRAKVQGCP